MREEAEDTRGRKIRKEDKTDGEAQERERERRGTRGCAPMRNEIRETDRARPEARETGARRGFYLAAERHAAPRDRDDADHTPAE